MQIQKLEDQFDIQIFDRSKKPIELTDIGKKVVEQAKIIVNESSRITISYINTKDMLVLNLE